MRTKLAAIILLTLIILGAGRLFSLYQEKKADRLRRQSQKADEISIRIIEGWTVEDEAAYLEQQGIIKKENFIKVQKNFDAKNYPLLKTKPANAGLEGFLFPDTYRIFKSVMGKPEAAEAVIKKQLDNFSLKFTEQMAQKAQELRKAIYEIVILASVIEKETGRNATTTEQKRALDEERKIVAGIFYNRLENNIALQSDATINYITKKEDPTPSAEDLQTNSPYNTYKNRGLPPGPICNPSLSSLIAALYPAHTDYLYFLHKQPSGEVVFSKTFEEHQKNKQLYLK